MLFSCLKSFMACIALKRKYSLPRMVYNTTYDPANASLSAASLPSLHSNSSQFTLCSRHSGLIFLLVFFNMSHCASCLSLCKSYALYLELCFFFPPPPPH